MKLRIIIACAAVLALPASAEQPPQQDDVKVDVGAAITTCYSLLNDANQRHISAVGRGAFLAGEVKRLEGELAKLQKPAPEPAKTKP